MLTRFVALAIIWIDDVFIYNFLMGLLDLCYTVLLRWRGVPFKVGDKAYYQVDDELWKHVTVQRVYFHWGARDWHVTATYGDGSTTNYAHHSWYCTEEEYTKRLLAS